MHLLLKELIRIAGLHVGGDLSDLGNRFEPRVLGDLVDGQPALWVYFKKLRYQIFGDTREALRPLDLEGEDVLKELILGSPLKRG